MQTARRHRILFTYILNKNWGLDEESKLLRTFVSETSHPLRTVYRYVYDIDWKADFQHKGPTLFGKGDLVLTDGAGHFLVVEIKYIDPSEGKTMRTRRTKKRKEVIAQTKVYLQAFRKQNRLPDSRVKGLVLTNECELLLV